MLYKNYDCKEGLSYKENLRTWATRDMWPRRNDWQQTASRKVTVTVTVVERSVRLRVRLWVNEWVVWWVRGTVVCCCREKLVAVAGDSSGSQKKGNVRRWKPLPEGWWSHSRLRNLKILLYNNNSVALVRERTIPTERPSPVGEVSANFCGWRVSRDHRGGFLRP
jgi:hypothetical protein